MVTFRYFVIVYSCLVPANSLDNAKCSCWKNGGTVVTQGANDVIVMNFPVIHLLLSQKKQLSAVCRYVARLGIARMKMMQVGQLKCFYVNRVRIIPCITWQSSYQTVVIRMASYNVRVSMAINHQGVEMMRPTETINCKIVENDFFNL